MTADANVVTILEPGDYLDITTAENPLRLVTNENTKPSMHHWEKALKTKCRFSAISN